MFRNIKYLPMSGENFAKYAEKKASSVVENVKQVIDDEPVVDEKSNPSDDTIDKLVGVIKFLQKTTDSPQFKGERHATFKMPDGSFQKANWCGPGTNISARLKDPNGAGKPINEVDKISKAHDLNYMFSKSEADVRKADERMLASLDKAEREGKDNSFNINQGKLIKGKVALENMGLSRTAFTTFESAGNLSQSERRLHSSARDQLIQEGYGTKFDDKDVEKFKQTLNPKPAERLYNSLVKKTKKRKKKRTRVPKSIQNRIRKNMEIDEQFQQTEVPDNVRQALDMF